MITVNRVASTIAQSNSPTFTVDQSLVYNELCQIYLCYLIEFGALSNIASTEIKIEISNLLNPESIQTTGPISIMSLMKYTADTKYYKIDEYTGDTFFQATKGTIDPAEISIVSLT